MRTRSVVLAVVGSVFALVALAMIMAGGGLAWAHAARSSDGYIESPTVRLGTDTHALVSPDVHLGAHPGDWIPFSGTVPVRVTVESETGEPVFVGVAGDDDVEAYLDGVARARVDEIRDEDSATYRTFDGGAPASPPATEEFWVASASGPGTQTLEWEIERGAWALVVMNADASSGVAVEASAGVETAILLPVGLGILAGGFLLGLVATAMLVSALRSPDLPAPPQQPVPPLVSSGTST